MNKARRRKIFMKISELRGKSTTKFRPHGVGVVIPKGIDDDIRYQMTRGRTYEEPEGRFVKKALSTGMNVIELGGSLGVISALIRSVIGKEALHIIVEANPTLIDTCRANATRGVDGAKTEIICAAIDYSGNATVTFANSGGAHVGMVSEDGNGITVPAIKLTDIVSELGNERFALVCDIEGMEAALFDNESGLLEQIDAIILETHPDAYSDGAATADRIINTCESAGLILIENTAHVLCFTRQI